ncbi:hypothetical protein C882_1659 [Caenispirillum salinarum AK4]|uniref:TonB-dependent receptor n=1 Tax=Caenispirillum salinarum AK4 TaxID=1238182 RepID=K9HXB7_9PROT|nr:hypothetical protein [Caenispirillum salinarum]EKV32821.1 hypothetical protein C882_1659 [Caenispirillum salinarum AK4]
MLQMSRPLILLVLGLAVSAAASAQEAADSPFGTAPLTEAEAARPAAPIRPLMRPQVRTGGGDVGDLDTYADAGRAGFATSRSDINQDIGLTPIIELTTPKLVTKGGGF